MFDLRSIRSTYIWIPISKSWHRFHLFMYFRFLNRGFKNNYKRNKNCRPYKIEKPNLDSLRLSEEIYKYFKKTDLLKVIKEKMIKTNDRTSYTEDIYNHLSMSIKSSIFDFAISDSKIQNFIKKYFGFRARLHSIRILYNIPKKNSILEGPKLWHRDTTDSDLRQIKIFIPITNINNQNGPLYLLRNENLAKEHLAILGTKDQYNDTRVRDKSIKKLNGNIFSSEGITKGYKIYFDSKRVYHKGGFAKSKDRLMLQLQFMGSAFSGDKPQDFYEEIKFLVNNKINYKSNKFLQSYLFEHKRFLNFNPFEKFVRYLFFRLGIIFTHYIKT